MNEILSQLETNILYLQDLLDRSSFIQAELRYLLKIDVNKEELNEYIQDYSTNQSYVSVGLWSEGRD